MPLNPGTAVGVLSVRDVGLVEQFRAGPPAEYDVRRDRSGAVESFGEADVIELTRKTIKVAQHKPVGGNTILYKIEFRMSSRGRHVSVERYWMKDGNLLFRIQK